VEDQITVGLDWKHEIIEKYSINYKDVAKNVKEDIGAGFNVIWKRS